DRAGDDVLPGGHPRRSRAGLPRPRHPAAAAVVGLHAEGCTKFPLAEPVLRAVPGRGDCCHGARTEPPGGWPEGFTRPEDGVKRSATRYSPKGIGRGGGRLHGGLTFPMACRYLTRWS